jgi:hypothetical protein
MVRGVDNSIIFKTATTRRDSQEDSAKTSLKIKKGEKIVGDENKQDKALKASPALASLF